MSRHQRGSSYPSARSPGTRYREAEPLFRRAIEIGEKILGKDHPTVARNYNNLAGLLQKQGKYDQAEPLYRRAIEIGERVLGKDHPHLAIRYNNLAYLLQDQGKYDQAEPLYRQAVETCKPNLVWTIQTLLR